MGSNENTANNLQCHVYCTIAWFRFKDYLEVKFGAVKESVRSLNGHGHSWAPRQNYEGYIHDEIHVALNTFLSIFQIMELSCCL